MNWQDFMENSPFSREEKLVAAFQFNRHLLTPEMSGLITAFTNSPLLMRKKLNEAFPELGEAVEAWENGEIVEKLNENDAEFV